MSTSLGPKALCAYCRLPVADKWDERGTAPVYCCLGCRIAAAMTASDDDTQSARYAMVRLGIASFFAVNAMMFSVILWDSPNSHDVASQGWKALDGLLRYVALLLSLPVYVLLAPPLIQEAWQRRRHGRGWLDALITLGTLTSFGVSFQSVVRGEGPVYFEVGCGVLLAVTVGRWLEATGRLRVGTTLDQLARTLPEQARLRRADGSVEHVQVESLQVGQHIVVGPNERVAVDARVVEGRAFVDEQATTGESAPAARWPGCLLYSGSLVLDGPLVVEVVQPACRSTWQRLVAAVQETVRQGYHAYPAADQAAQLFLPLTLLVAAGAYLYHTWQGSWHDGLFAALSVLVVACPCALGIAIPLASWVALERAARFGALIRDTSAFVKLSDCQVLCFDKTGTLTTGRPVGQPVWSSQARHDVLLQQILATSVHVSSHPLTRALRTALPLPELPLCITSQHVVSGQGVRFEVRFPDGDKGTLLLGSRHFLDQQSVDWSPLERQLEITHENPEDFALLVAYNGRCHAAFRFEEEIRSEAAAVIEWFKQQGGKIFVLSGDRPHRVRKLVEKLHIDGTGQLSPLDKQTHLSALRSRYGTTVMVGDAINDVPALSSADVSVAIGCGVDAAQRVAHIALVQDDLTRLPWLVELARQTRRTIRRNLAWAFTYNSVGLMFAAAHFLHPAVAAALMMASSFWVVGSSLRLGGFPAPSNFYQPGHTLTVTDRRLQPLGPAWNQVGHLVTEGTLCGF